MIDRSVLRAAYTRLVGPAKATPVLALLLVLFALALPGCTIVNYVTYLFGGPDRERPVEVKPEYQGLVGKKTAVIVAADQYTYGDYPSAPMAICKAVSQQLATQVKGITITDPKKIVGFQEANPYWNTQPYSQLVKTLKVERLVYIDIAEYALHEQGNENVWRGVIVANVSVVEADGKSPDDFGYSTSVTAQFPPDNPIGLTSSNDGTIQAGLLGIFSKHVAGLFNEKGTSVPR